MEEKRIIKRTKIALNCLNWRMKAWGGGQIREEGGERDGGQIIPVYLKGYKQRGALIRFIGFGKFTVELWRE